MNKKTIILLALTCGVMYQNAGANFGDGSNIKHLHDKIAHHHITKHLEQVHKDLEKEQKGEA